MRKITKEIAQKIIDLYVVGEKCINLSEKFEISLTQIGKIVRGDFWKNCERPSNILSIIKERQRERMRERMTAKARLWQDNFPPLTKF